MKSVCSGFFLELLLFSALVFPDVVMPMTNTKECLEQKTQKENTIVIRNIGIKMCELRCIETGGCLRFEFDIDTLTCRLRLGDSNAMEKKKGITPHHKTDSDVTPGPCSSTSCSPGARCLESRSGKPVCVKSGRVFYPSRSQQQRRDKKSGSGDSLLHEACREGDLSQLQTIISKGQVDIDSREEEYGRTPVMLAARGGYRDMFEFLVRNKCNMSLLDNNGNNILYMACYGGQIAIVKQVLSFDTVDLNSRGQFGRTCVMVAAHRGKMDLFKYLVKTGSNLSMSDKTGDTILHIACRGGHVDMVKYIISQDVVDVNSKGRGDKTVAMVAAHFGYRNIFDLCACAGCNLSAVDAEDNNVLHVAILGGYIKMVKHVLAQGLVNINSRGMDGKTPLMFAAVKGRKDMFDLVMNKGGDATLVDTDGDNILHWACNGGHEEMVKYVILQSFTDINSRGHCGKTPMMVAAAHGHKNVFDLLMSQGGIATLVDNAGENILHFACRGGHVPMVKHIISHKLVDINSRGRDGATPMMVAAYAGHSEVFDLLMSEGGNATLVDNIGRNILHVACLGGHVEMVKHTISQNLVGINSRRHGGATSMMLAAYAGHNEVFDLLMSQGGNATLVHNTGSNILHLACLAGHVEMVKHVISQTLFDINSRRHDGATSMMLAAYAGHNEVFNLLMSEGGNATLVDNTGSNILHVACHGGHVEMVKHIISQNLVGINSRRHDGATSMSMAATAGHSEVFDLLMSEGGNATLVDNTGRNILHLACHGGHVEMVKHIISHKLVDINSRGRDGATPMLIAAYAGHSEVFDLLMSQGGDATLVDNTGSNILHLACLAGHVEMVKHVISQTLFDIHSRRHDGATSMMLAAYAGHNEVFDLLMSEGGNATLVDNTGSNILHLACHGGHVEMVKHVISQNLVGINSRRHDGATSMMVASTAGHSEVFDLLMSEGGNATLVDNTGRNILHLACHGGHVEMVKHIISQNLVGINSRRYDGRTPLMMSAIDGHRDMFDLVKSKGGDASIVDGHGANVLHWACLKGNVMMVKHILSNTTVDVNAKDKYGRTAAMLAKNSNKEMYDLLTSSG